MLICKCFVRRVQRRSRRRSILSCCHQGFLFACGKLSRTIVQDEFDLNWEDTCLFAFIRCVNEPLPLAKSISSTTLRIFWQNGVDITFWGMVFIIADKIIAACICRRLGVEATDEHSNHTDGPWVRISSVLPYRK
jgi:hypothetical protein